jgi:iron complex transport system substrate-binding protein
VRIVSLLPGATESLFALGLGESVVGVSHECDHPPAARELPRVTRSRLDLEGLDGRAIESRVAGGAQAGQELYSIDLEAIRALRPDLVVVQDVCEVCAVPAAQAEGGLAGVPVLRQHAHSLDGVLRDIDELAAACGVVGSAVTDRLRSRLRAAAERAAGLRPVTGVFLEWLDPPYLAGHWTPDLLRLAGIQDPLARAGVPSVAVSWDAVAAARPELLLLAPCGFVLERAQAEARRVAAEIDSVGARRVAVFDGSAYFNRAGPRLVDSLELLVRETEGYRCLV